MLRVHDVLFRLGHLLNAAALCRSAALLTLPAFLVAPDQVRGKQPGVNLASVGFLRHHALREEARKRLIRLRQTEIAHRLCEKPRVEQMQDRMFDASDILIHRHPVIGLRRLHRKMRLVRGAVAKKVPGGIDECVHRVGFTPSRGAAFGTGCLHKRLDLRER